MLDYILTLEVFPSTNKQFYSFPATTEDLDFFQFWC